MPQEQDKNQQSTFPTPPHKGERISNEKTQASYFLFFEAAIEFAVILGLPLYAFIQLGKWLDKKWGIHFMVLIGIFTALSLSSYLIYKKINQYGKLLK